MAANDDTLTCQLLFRMPALRVRFTKKKLSKICHWAAVGNSVLPGVEPRNLFHGFVSLVQYQPPRSIVKIQTRSEPEWEGGGERDA